MSFYGLFQTDSFLSHLGDIALLLLVVFLCYSLTEKFLSRYIKVNFSFGVEKFVFLGGLGLGIFAYAILILGLCGFLYEWVFYALILIAILSVWDRIKDGLLRFRAVRFDAALILKHKLLSAFLFLFAVFAVINLIGTLTPPTAWDELTYHLALPKLFIQHHRIFNVPNIMFSSYIMVQNMFYIFGMLVKSDILAKLFHFAMGILTSLAIYSFCRNYSSSKVSLLSALIFYSIPVVTKKSMIAYNDLGLTFFQFLAFYATVKWLLLEEDRWLVLGAVFCGLALGTKYFGAFSYISAVLLIFSAGVIYKKMRFIDLIKRTGLFSAVAFLVSFVWYLKNYIYFGNPVFPLFNNMFRSQWWYPISYTDSYHGPQPWGVGTRVIDYLILPWNLYFKDTFFGWEQIGPILLMFLPLLLVLVVFKKKRLEAALKYVIIFGLSFYVLWAVSDQYNRYLIPLYPFLGILSGYTIFSLASSFQKNYARALIAFVMILIFFNLPFFSACWLKRPVYSNYPPQALRSALGLISRDQYLLETRMPGYSNNYPAVKFVNENLPADAKVLSLWGFFQYYYERDVVQDYEYYPAYKMALIDLFWPKVTRESWEDFFKKVKELKFTHLVIDFESNFLSDNGLTIDGFDDLARTHLKLLYSYGGAMKVYEVLR